MSGTLILLGAVAAATAVGTIATLRSGTARKATGVGDEVQALLVAAGASATGPTVLHFSATWCGPCAAVRRVVAATLRDFPGTTDLEVDIDADPALARALGVLSLPTTFVYDAALTQSRRIAGVPRAEELRAALIPLSGH